MWHIENMDSFSDCWFEVNNECNQMETYRL